MASSGVQDRGHLRDVARSFLNANDILYLREPHHRGWLDVHASPPLHAVKNNGQRNAFRDRAIVLEQAFLRRLVVVGRHREDSVRAELGKFAREGNHFRSVVAPGAGKDRYLSLGELDGDLDDAKMLFLRQRGALAGRSARNEKIHARIDLSLDQSSQGGFVKRTIASKRSDKCGTGACEHHAVPSFSSQFNSLRISRNSYMPFFPTIHRAARSAPRANPSRLRAVWRSVMVSPGQSKPIS